MRLTDKQVAQIKQNFSLYFLPQDHLWLFGSRTDPNAKGGDIDLYVETHLSSASKVMEAKIKFLTHLKMAIGEQKIDLVVKYNDTDLPIYHVAQQEGIRLI